MEVSVTWIPLVVILALAAGWALGQYWRARWIRRNKARLRKEARYILAEAEREGQAKIYDAELQARGILVEERRQFESRRSQAEEELGKRETLIRSLLERIDKEKTELEEARRENDKLRCNLERREGQAQELLKSARTRLEEISGLDQEQARRQFIKEAEEGAGEQASRRVREIVDTAQENAQRTARKITIAALERLSRSVVAEYSVCSVPLPSQEMKGRVIGRDGRNVRAFEAVAGVDLLLDEESNVVTLSCHNPLRREIARTALQRLIEDGRIQPSRIEECVAWAENEIKGSCRERGREAACQLELSAFPDALCELVGQLSFRSSFSQNVLKHSIETGLIGGLITGELGLDRGWQEKARRAGLLHDCGKALSEIYHGPHSLVGSEYLRRLGEAAEIVNAVAAHHCEIEDQSLIAPVVRAADALSGARPGARREDLESYIKRLDDLEKLAGGFKGVERAYVFQAGREVHVSVAPGEIADNEVQSLAERIAAEIQLQFRYGGPVKVSVLRETKGVGVARWGEQVYEQ